MGVIFFFHCARFFDEGGWHVKNRELSFGMSVFTGVVSQWIMPLFFVLSAVAAFHALSRRSNGAYAAERFKRLFVPLVFGIFVLIPPQVYVERVSHGAFSGSYFAFYPHYFDGFYAFGGNFAWMGLHLWYLEVLFVFSLITLPVFRMLQSATAHKRIRAAAGRMRAATVFRLPALVLAGVELLVSLQPEGVGRRDFGGWSLATYLVFFVFGFVLAADERFSDVLQRHWLKAALGAAATTSAGYFLVTSGHAASPGFLVLRALNSWLWVTAILGIAGRFLQTGGRFLPMANEAVLPFYILHQTVIVLTGFVIAGRDAPVPVKFAVLAGTSFAVVIVLYTALVRRIAVLRFLFGMKPKQQAAAPYADGPGPAGSEA